MAGSSINARVRLSIELALTRTKASKSLLAKQEEVGRALGMTGAEMDSQARFQLRFRDFGRGLACFECLSGDTPARTARRSFRGSLRGDRIHIAGLPFSIG